MKALWFVLLCPGLAATARLASAAEVPNTLVQTIHAPPVGTQVVPLFGHCVAVDGAYAVVGIPSDDTGAHKTGVVKVFDSSTGALLFVLRNPSRPPDFDNFGRTVAISGFRVAVGGKYFVYVFDLTSATPEVPVVTLTGAGFGYSVALSGTRVVVGDGGGKAFVFDLASPTATIPVVVLEPPTAGTGDAFGIAVAISGTRVVVGDPRKETGANNSGRAYVFDLGSATPTVPVTTLNNPAPNPEDNFGSALAISGTRVVVAENLPVGTVGTAWTAYVYDLGTGTPAVPVVTLPDPQTSPSTEFSSLTRVSISGTRVVLGAHGSDAGAIDAGIAVVYDLATASPTVPVMTLNNPAPELSDQFGYSVAIAGTKVVVSAPYEDTFGYEAGNVFLYEISGSIPPEPVSVANDPGPAAWDHFGWSVAVSGTRAVVGAPDDDTGASNAGSAYVYDLSNDTPTVPAVALQNPTPVADEQFGTSVAIAGLYAAVGCPKDDAGAGSVYVYDLGSATPTAPAITLKQPGGPVKGGQFGSALALSGSLLVVGRANLVLGSNVDKVYVYDLASGTPAVPVGTLNNPFPLGGDQFGASVGISGTRVVVGAPGDDMGATDAGSVYVFDLSSATPGVPVAALENPMLPQVLGFGRNVAISGARVAVVPYQRVGGVFVYDLNSATPTTPAFTLTNPRGVMLASSVAISGTFLAVAAREDQDIAGTITWAGSTHLYDLASQTPTVPLTTLYNPSPAYADYFGWSIAIDGSVLAIGAPHDDTMMADKGSVYVYGSPSAEIVVQAGAGPSTLPDGGSQSLGSVFVNGATTLHYTIKNIGTLPLTGLATSIDGPNAADFTVVSSPMTTINGPSGNTSLSVRFSPSSLGAKTATLHIVSNDADESPFDITLTGTGIETVNRVVNQGSPVSFSVDVPAGTTVQWRKDGVDIPGAVGSTLTFGSVQPWQIGVYSARVTAAGGSSVRDVAVLGLTGVPAGPWRGLVSCYRFDSSAEDFCRPNKPASFKNTSGLETDPQRGGVAHVQGKGFGVPPLGGEPIELQGPGGYIQIPKPPLGDGEPFTVSFVIKEEGFSYQHGESFLTMGDLLPLHVIGHYWIGSLSDPVENYAGPGGAVEPYASTYVLNGSAVTLDLPWTTYTVVAEGGLARLYRDGQLMGTSPYPTVPVADFFIGRHSWSDGSRNNYSTRLVACFDDLRIFNRALTPTEVGELSTLVQATPPLGSFESWVLIHGLVGTDTGPSADPDRDDLTNQDEFRLGTSPTDGTQLPVKATVTGTTLRLEWLGKNDVVYGLKETSDLLDPWASSAAVPVLSTDQSDVPAGFKRMQVDVAVPSSGTSAAPRFFRVEATKAP